MLPVQFFQNKAFCPAACNGVSSRPGALGPRPVCCLHAGGDAGDAGGATRALFDEALARDGYFDLSGTPEFAALRDTYGFISGTSSHADRLAEIARTEKESGYLLDPHTADGVHVARAVRPQIEGPLVVMETALPVKFADTILQATGHLPPVPERFEGIEGREERVTALANSAEDLKALIRERVRPGA